MKPFDPLGALGVLIRDRVDFVLIGGLAARLRGSPTVTDDLDICHSRELDNLGRLAASLQSMDARLRGADGVPFLLDAKTLHKGQNFTFSTEFGALDCLGLPPGTGGYEDLLKTADLVDLEDLRLRVVSLDDLIRMKRAAGRPKDRIELEILGALRDELEGKPED